MKWLTLFSLLVKLALQIIAYLERRDAIEAGRAEAVKDLLERADEMAKQAEAARNNVDLSVDAELHDPYNIDNEPVEKRVAGSDKENGLPKL